MNRIFPMILLYVMLFPAFCLSQEGIEPENPAYYYETYYGVKYDMGIMDAEFDPSQLVVELNKVMANLNIEFDGLKVIENLNLADIARITKSAPDESGRSKLVLFISADVAYNPARLHTLLSEEYYKSFAEKESERIEAARKDALVSTLNGDGYVEEDPNVITQAIAKTSVNFIEGLDDMMRGMKEEAFAGGGIKLPVYDHYLTFDQMFPESGAVDYDTAIAKIDYEESTDEQLQEGEQAANSSEDFVHRTYHENGNLSGEYPFISGVLNGLVREYYENGELMRETEFSHDKENGLRRVFYESGKLFSQISLLDGKEEGPYKEYHENGEVAVEVMYMHGERIGVYKEFFEDGTLKYEEPYDQGKVQGITKEYYENGNLKMETAYLQGVPEGESREYYESGAVKYVSTYQNGILNGTSQEFHENGNLLSKVVFVDDQMEGIAKFYSESGILESEIEFKNGQQDGEFKEYFENGNLRAKGSFINGLLVERVVYNENGEVIEEENI